MAALLEMKLDLQLAKHDGVWLLESPEAEIAFAYEQDLEDDDGPEILRLLRRRWTRPQRVMVRWEAETKTVLSYLCEVVQRASERSYLEARPQDKCSRASGSRPPRATGPKRSETSGTVSAPATRSTTGSSESS